MLHRHLAFHLHRNLQQQGPLLLQGPRGSGKTTLVTRELPGRLYVSLEDAADRAAAGRDPEAFLARLRRPAVIDDVERSPELVDHLRARVSDLPIVFVTNMRLKLGMAALELHPPTRAERLGRPAMPLEILGRFSPEGRREDRPPPDSFPPSREFLWRDVPRLLRPHDADRFEEFAGLVAERSGMLLHQQELARETGVAHRTVVRWLEVLDACFLTLRIDPLEQDFGRRQVKRPRLHSLGSTATFETEVVTEIYRNARHDGLSPVLRHWRDSNGLEVPLIVRSAAGEPMTPCAIAAEPGPPDEVRLRRWMRLARLSAGALIGRRRNVLQRRPAGVLRYSFLDL